jgi:hypothetical protein
MEIEMKTQYNLPSNENYRREVEISLDGSLLQFEETATALTGNGHSYSIEAYRFPSEEAARAAASSAKSAAMPINKFHPRYAGLAVEKDLRGFPAASA